MTVAELRQVESGRAIIDVDTDEFRVTNAAIGAISRHPDVYQRGGALVQVITDSRPSKGVTRPASTPYITRIRDARLRDILSEQCDFRKMSAPSPKKPSEPYSVHVPKWVSEQIAARDQWEKIRHLEAVSATPMLRPDGSVLDEPGFDRATGVLYQPTRTFPRVADRVSIEQAQRALSALEDVFCDFPFAEPEHRACVLAGVLTPLARHAFAGPSPMVVIDKNIRGAGGSLLSDAIATCSTGRGIARMVQSATDDEDRKRILSIALSGDSMVLIDNITRPLGGAALDAVLTGVEFRDRILGRSEMVTAPLLACWFATGNNIQIMGDTLRRILPVRLESQHENPEERKGFKHEHLLDHIRSQHPTLVVAALTILKGYVQAGRPDLKLSPWGSFEGWSNLVRNALVWVGMTDPAKARQQLQEGADAEVVALRVIFEHWRLLDTTGTGVTAARILETVNSVDPQDQSDTLQAVRDALMELAPTAFGKATSAKALGKRLKHFKGRIVKGNALDSKTSNMGERWMLRQVKPVG
ncbi:MAG TPA: hypothetical protein VI653_00635 [Steroidobacteraceae bacterium]